MLSKAILDKTLSQTKLKPFMIQTTHKTPCTYKVTYIHTYKHTYICPFACMQYALHLFLKLQVGNEKLINISSLTLMAL